jgi:hypothetical protein
MKSILLYRKTLKVLKPFFEGGRLTIRGYSLFAWGFGT